MKKFTLIMSLFIGLSGFFSCKDKDEPAPSFKLNKNELNLIVGQSASFEIKGGNAPYTLDEDEHIEATAKGKVITIKALKTNAVAFNSMPVVLTLKDKAGKKQEVKINIFNSLDVDTQDVELYEGQTAKVSIKSGKIDAFKVAVKDEKIATAEIVSEKIGTVELKKILVTAKDNGNTELNFSDGITTKSIKLIVKKIKPISIWASVNGELKQIDSYTIKAGEAHSLVIKGGAGKYVLNYDKEKLTVGEVTEHEDDFIVKVAPSTKLTKSQDVKLKVSQEGDTNNSAEITIKVDVPEQVFSTSYLKGGQVYVPTNKNSADEDILKARIGEELVIKLQGGSGDYYVKLSDGQQLIDNGATGLVKGKKQYGGNQYDVYLIPSGTIKIKANKSFKINIPFFAVLDKGTFISREQIYVDIDIN